jgi:hypothetical protein
MSAMSGLILAVSFIGIPGMLMGLLAGRREGYAPAAAAVLLAVLGLVIIGIGWGTDPVSVVVLLPILVINVCTAVAGLALVRHVRSRDAHLD